MLSSNNNADSTMEDASTATDYTSLIRSSPSKVIVGFDVLTTWAPPSLISKQYRFPHSSFIITHTYMVHICWHTDLYSIHILKQIIFWRRGQTTTTTTHTVPKQNNPVVYFSMPFLFFPDIHFRHSNLPPRVVDQKIMNPFLFLLYIIHLL